MNGKKLKEAYVGLSKYAEEQGVLYTEKEIKMHVFGPKDLCDSELYFRFKQEDYPDCKLLPDEALSYHQRGFCFLRDAIDPSRVRAAREYIDSQYKSWLAMSKRQDDWRIHLLLNLETLAEVPIEHAPLLNMVLNSPKILGRLEDIIGSKPTSCFYNQVAYRTPLVNYSPSILNYTPGAEYHIDGQANDYGTRFPDPWTVLIAVALVDIDSLDMGNFTVFPGTHASRNWSSYPEEKRLKTLPSLGEPFKVQLKAGDCVFVHVLLPHRGGKNITTSEDAIQSGIDYEGLLNIPQGTREMMIFRFRGSHIDYNHPNRSPSVLNDPFFEHGRVVRLVQESNEASK